MKQKPDCHETWQSWNWTVMKLDGHDALNWTVLKLKGHKTGKSWILTATKIDGYEIERSRNSMVMKVDGHERGRWWNWTVVKLDGWLTKRKSPLLKWPSTFTESLTYPDRIFFRAGCIHFFGPVTFMPVKYGDPNFEHTVHFCMAV